METFVVIFELGKVLLLQLEFALDILTSPFFKKVELPLIRLKVLLKLDFLIFFRFFPLNFILNFFELIFVITHCVAHFEILGDF